MGISGRWQREAKGKIYGCGGGGRSDGSLKADDWLRPQPTGTAPKTKQTQFTQFDVSMKAIKSDGTPSYESRI